jgi:hypothetical protein
LPSPNQCPIYGCSVNYINLHTQTIPIPGRPPLANDRLKILDDGTLRLQLKKPWSDGTSSVDLEPLAFIARLAALVPLPRRHVEGLLLGIAFPILVEIAWHV